MLAFVTDEIEDKLFPQLEMRVSQVVDNKANQEMSMSQAGNAVTTELVKKVAELVDRVDKIENSGKSDMSDLERRLSQLELESAPTMTIESP